MHTTQRVKGHNCFEVSDQNKTTICAFHFGIDGSNKVSLNSSNYLQISSAETIIALYSYCINNQEPLLCGEGPDQNKATIYAFLLGIDGSHKDSPVVAEK
jgi:hypothetical protein